MKNTDQKNYSISLFEYVNDVKPYHVKTLNVSEEYTFEENLKVKISEDYNLKVFASPYVNNFTAYQNLQKPNMPFYKVSPDTSTFQKRIFNSPVKQPTWEKTYQSDGKKLKFAFEAVIPPYAKTITNTDFQNPLQEFLPYSYHIPTDDSNNSKIIIQKNNNLLQEGIDYYHSKGSFSITVTDYNSSKKWIAKTHKKFLETTNFQNQAPFYHDINPSYNSIYQTHFGKITNISSTSIEEFTVYCINDDDKIFEVKGSHSGIISTFQALALTPIIFTNSIISFTFQRYANIPLSDNKDDENDNDFTYDIKQSKITITPSNLIAVNPSSPNQDWYIIKTSANIINSISSNKISVIPNSLVRNSPNTTFTIQFISPSSYTVTRNNITSPIQIYNNSNKSYKDQYIEFVLNKTFSSNEIITITLKEQTHYKVYGSVSGYTDDAIVDQYYYNGHIGFKIPKLEAFSSDTFLQETSIHPDAIPCEYEIKKTSDTTALVTNNFYQNLPGLTLNETWSDGMFSFKLTSFNNKEIITIALVPSYDLVTLNSYDQTPYDNLPYDARTSETIIPTIFNSEYYPLYDNRQTIFFIVQPENAEYTITKYTKNKMAMKVGLLPLYTNEDVNIRKNKLGIFHYDNEDYNGVYFNLDIKDDSIENTPDKLALYLKSNNNYKVLTLDNTAGYITFEKDFIDEFIRYDNRGIEVTFSYHQKSGTGKGCEPKIFESLLISTFNLSSNDNYSKLYFGKYLFDSNDNFSDIDFGVETPDSNIPLEYTFQTSLGSIPKNSKIRIFITITNSTLEPIVINSIISDNIDIQYDNYNEGDVLVQNSSVVFYADVFTDNTNYLEQVSFNITKQNSQKQLIWHYNIFGDVTDNQVLSFMQSTLAVTGYNSISYNTVINNNVYGIYIDNMGLENISGNIEEVSNSIEQGYIGPNDNKQVGLKLVSPVVDNGDNSVYYNFSNNNGILFGRFLSKKVVSNFGIVYDLDYIGHQGDGNVSLTPIILTNNGEVNASIDNIGISDSHIQVVSNNCQNVTPGGVCEVILSANCDDLGQFGYNVLLESNEEDFVLDGSLTVLEALPIQVDRGVINLGYVPKNEIIRYHFSVDLTGYTLLNVSGITANLDYVTAPYPISNGVFNFVIDIPTGNINGNISKICSINVKRIADNRLVDLNYLVMSNVTNNAILDVSPSPANIYSNSEYTVIDVYNNKSYDVPIGSITFDNLNNNFENNIGVLGDFLNNYCYYASVAGNSHQAFLRYSQGLSIGVKLKVAQNVLYSNLDGININGSNAILGEGNLIKVMSNFVVQGDVNYSGYPDGQANEVILQLYNTGTYKGDVSVGAIDNSLLVELENTCQNVEPNGVCYIKFGVVTEQVGVYNTNVQLLANEQVIDVQGHIYILQPVIELSERFESGLGQWSFTSGSSSKMVLSLDSTNNNWLKCNTLEQGEGPFYMRKQVSNTIEPEVISFRFKRGNGDGGRGAAAILFYNTVYDSNNPRFSYKPRSSYSDSMGSSPRFSVESELNGVGGNSGYQGGYGLALESDTEYFVELFIQQGVENASILRLRDYTNKEIKDQYILPKAFQININKVEIRQENYGEGDITYYDDIYVGPIKNFLYESFSNLNQWDAYGDLTQVFNIQGDKLVCDYNAGAMQTLGKIERSVSGAIDLNRVFFKFSILMPGSGATSASINLVNNGEDILRFIPVPQYSNAIRSSLMVKIGTDEYNVLLPNNLYTQEVEYIFDFNVKQRVLHIRQLNGSIIHTETFGVGNGSITFNGLVSIRMESWQQSAITIDEMYLE